MLVLGVDCGTERTGYGVISSDGRAHRMVAFGTIVTSPKQPLSERLLTISRGLREVIAAWSPQFAAIEAVFHASNTQTALKLAHVRGVAMLAIAEAGLPCGEYSPLEVKSSVAGYGRAEKAQVQLMVHSLLAVETKIASADACDALAVAICHATHTHTSARMGVPA